MRNRTTYKKDPFSLMSYHPLFIAAMSSKVWQFGVYRIVIAFLHIE